MTRKKGQIIHHREHRLPLNSVPSSSLVAADEFAQSEPCQLSVHGEKTLHLISNRCCEVKHTKSHHVLSIQNHMQANCSNNAWCLAIERNFTPKNRNIY